MLTALKNHGSSMEKPNPLSTNVLARFFAFCFSCDSCRNQTTVEPL